MDEGTQVSHATDCDRKNALELQVDTAQLSQRVDGSLVAPALDKDRRSGVELQRRVTGDRRHNRRTRTSDVFFGR